MLLIFEGKYALNGRNWLFQNTSHSLIPVITKLIMNSQKDKRDSEEVQVNLQALWLLVACVHIYLCVVCNHIIKYFGLYAYIKLSLCKNHLFSFGFVKYKPSKCNFSLKLKIVSIF